MKLLGKFLLYMLALVGIVALSQFPPIKSLGQKFINKMSQTKFRSSFAKSQIKNLGVKFYGGVGMPKKNKIDPKQTGKWLVGKLPSVNPGEKVPSTNIDSEDLEQVIISSKSGDLIEIQPGAYEVNNLDLDHALTITGLGKGPTDVQINVKEKTLFEIGSGDNRIQISKVTIRSLSENFKQAAIWIGPNLKVSFTNTEMFSHAQEKGIRIDENSILELDQCFLSAGPRGTAVELQNNAILRASNSTIKNNKTAIYGHIDNFKGAIQLERVEIIQSGAKAIDIYQGQLLMKGGKMTQNMASLSIRNQAKGLLENVEISHNELSGIDMYKSVLEIRGGLFHHNSQADIVARKPETSLTIFQSQFSDSRRGLELLEGPKVNINDSHFELLKEDAIMASRDVELNIKGGRFNRNHRGLFIDRSKVTIEGTIFEENDLGIHLENKSEAELIRIKKVNNKEFLHNTYNNSTVNQQQ